MAGKGGLFAVMGPPEEEDELEDYAGDLEDPAIAEDEPLGAGPLDAYAETIFDTEADPVSRTDALRQFVLTVQEEMGRKPPPL
jgi:hypothetical protein